MKTGKAIIFDLDGVLVDTEPIKFKAYQAAFKKAFGILIEDLPDRIGLKRVEAIPIFLEKYHLNNNKNADVNSIASQIKSEYSKILGESITEICGAKEFVQRVSSSYKTGIGTSSDRNSYETIRKRLTWFNLLDVVLTKEDVTFSKPNPEIYLKCARLLNVNPANCIVIEDSHAGIQAAKNAGMKCIAITTTTKKNSLVKADIIVNEFKEISDILLT